LSCLVKQIRPGTLSASQLPAKVTDARGQTIGKPSTW
jgi:hypothetical protein